MKNKLFWVLFVISALFHVIYILNTSYNERCHDIAQIQEMTGHSGYIQYIIFNNMHLPNISPLAKWQFYHPPLHHFLSAVFIKVLIFVTNMNMKLAFESLQALMVLYSLLVILFTYKICRELNFENLTTNIVTAFIMFHPILIFTSGCVNNDMLCFLLCTMGIYYTIKWSKEPNTFNTILLALVTGLSVAAKLSGLILFPAIIAVFIYKFIKYAKERKYISRSFFTYILIYIPIASWWNIRCLVKYNMPLFYINPTDFETIPCNNWLIDRIFSIHNVQFLSPYISGPEETNIVIYLLKSSLFGEYNFSDQTIYLALTLLCLNIILIVIMMFSFLFMFNKNQQCISTEIKIFLFTLFVTLTAGYLKFNIDYPVICTQDFRYLLLYLIIFGIALGSFVQRTKNIGMKYFIIQIIIAFAICSLLFFATALFCR